MGCDQLHWGQGLGLRVRTGSQVPEPSGYVGLLPGRKHARRMVAGGRHRGLSFRAAGSASHSGVVSLDVLWGRGEASPMSGLVGTSFVGDFTAAAEAVHSARVV